MTPTLTSELTCPECRYVERFTMPEDACQWFLECPACHVVLRPKAGDCCVFCSYGTEPCPPVQKGEGCCG
ncbi:GDCCVxC domain-containing (seleno)protein [Shimia aestuarii]|uniref:GDCCVxC domain-containing (seleno)protein n=1 Tax=Shimia aestuarii TaxID=254406 RepID=UPI000B808D90|nr:GDCCVxC domain-containing (seleno)protein [Shimia aestuarii]